MCRLPGKGLNKKLTLRLTNLPTPYYDRANLFALHIIQYKLIRRNAPDGAVAAGPRGQQMG